MRGRDHQEPVLFSYIALEQRVPEDHPLRPIRAMANGALHELSPVFDTLYSTIGRPSIPPERLLRATLLQILYSIRSERLLMEEISVNLLFLWFVGLNIDDPVWDASTFSQNRDRLLEGEVSRRFLDAVLAQARREDLLSDEHFSVDGTLIEAWASIKSFRPKGSGTPTPPPAACADEGRNPTVDFRGEKLSNDTHASTTDPEARLYRKSKGQEAKLAFLGHATMENRHGLIVDTRTTQATGTAEREAAADMLAGLAGSKRITAGADKGYDTKDFVKQMKRLRVTPHVAQNQSAKRRSAIDGRTTRHEGYRMSLQIRKRIEEFFGWAKTVGPMDRPMVRGTARMGWLFTFTAAAYNLVRMRKLLATPSPA
jgi:transposase